MDIKTIKENIESIRVQAEDEDNNEQAHIEEDALHIAVLESISSGCDNPKELATEALKSQEISFDRECI